MPEQTRWSKWAVEWLVARMHVSLTDDAVREQIALRTANAPGWTPEDREQATEYALKCHHDNQAIYEQVQTGRIPARRKVSRNAFGRIER